MEDNYFTILWWFWPYISMSQPQAYTGFLGGSAGKESACYVGGLGSILVGKIHWRRERLPTLVFWPGELHGLYSPWGHKESDTTKWLWQGIRVSLHLQQRRHRGKGQSFGFSGRRRGWGDLREWHWNIYITSVSFATWIFKDLLKCVLFPLIK